MGGPHPLVARLVVGSLVVVALVLRLSAFRQSFFGDELFTYEIATRGPLHAVLDGVRSSLEISPPLYFIVAWGFGKLGDPFVWLRVPSLLAGVATVPLIYLLGARTVGRSAAFVGAAMFAISPLAVFYATEARAYSWMTLLVVLSTLSLLRAVETPHWGWWMALALFDAGAMLSHYTSIFIIATQALWALFTHRARMRQLVLTHLAAAFLLVPWLPGLLQDQAARAQRPPRMEFTTQSSLRTVGQIAAGQPYVRLSALPGTPALWLVGVALGIGLLGRVWRLGSARPARGPSALVWLLALVPAICALAYSTAGDNLFVARNLFSSLPMVVLAMAALLVALPRRIGAVALVLAFTGVGLGTVATFDAATHRPPYDQAAEFINSRARPGDVVLELQAIRGEPGRALVVHLLPTLPHYAFGTSDALQAAQASGGRIFYVFPGVKALGNIKPTGVMRAFVAHERRTWAGFYSLTVVVYEPEHPTGAGT